VENYEDLNDNHSTGKVSMYHKNGQKKMDLFFENGEISYLDTLFYPNGLPKIVFETSDVNDSITVVNIRNYFEDGSLKKEMIFDNWDEKYAYEKTRYTSKRAIKKHGNYL